MIQQNAKLSQQVVGKLALQGARHLIWDQIIIEDDKFRPYLDFVEDQENTLTEAKKKVQIVLGEVQRRPLATTENAINFLGSFSDDSANRYGIQNRVVVVSGARKVVAKHRMLETVQAKIKVIEHKVLEVVKIFRPLVCRGLPFFWEEKGPLLSSKEYQKFLNHCRLDNNKFGDMQQSLSGKVVFDKLTMDFLLLFDFKAACNKAP